MLLVVRKYRYLNTRILTRYLIKKVDKMFNNKTILVTGGTGSFGKNLSKYYLVSIILRR